jgi:hypothetical protein
VDAAPPRGRGAAAGRGAGRPARGAAGRRNRLPVRPAVRRGRRRLVAVAGAARPGVRRRRPPVPGGTPGRHRGRTRRGPRDHLLAGRWLSVDLPEALELRTRLLPRSQRQRLVAASATDERWLDLVDTRAGTLVTTQGLLMYLQPSEVHDLVARCAARLPGGSMVFDAVPLWLARQTQRRRLGAEGGYRPPPWTWGLDRAERRRLAATPNVGRPPRAADAPRPGSAVRRGRPRLRAGAAAPPRPAADPRRPFSATRAPDAGRTPSGRGEANRRMTRPARREVST